MVLYDGDNDAHQLLKFTRENAVEDLIFKFDKEAVDLVWFEHYPAVVLFNNNVIT